MSLSQSLSRPLSRTISGSLVGGVIVVPPSGFDWSPPLTVRNSGGTYSTDFDADDWKVSSTAEIWVSTTGSNGGGDGTKANPYAGIYFALQKAAALADAGVSIYVMTGVYNRLQGWASETCDKNINVIAVDGAVISSTRFEPLSWSLYSAGVYAAARSSVDDIRDELFADSDGVAQKLISVATIAECESTLGSWYTDGSTLYVHTQDEREPDSALLVLASVGNGIFGHNKRWYIEGLEFEGGTVAAFNTSSGTIGTSAEVIFNNSKFRYAPTGNGIAANGIPLTIAYKCDAYANGSDGFNYHLGSNGIDPKTIEIQCSAYKNGAPDGANNDNGSTMHENGRIVRVSGRYRENIGPQVIDINTSQSWNLGCKPSSSASTAEDGTNAGFRTQNSAAMFLEGCSATDSTFGAITSETSTIRYRRSSLGAMSGDVAKF